MKPESVFNRVSVNEPASGASRTTARLLMQGVLWRRARAWWIRMLRLRLRAPRRLRLCESLPLGERRFVAVVEFERARFLVGGTAASLVLLARLEKTQGESNSQPTDRADGITQECHE